MGGGCLVEVRLHDEVPLITGLWKLGFVLFEPVVEVLKPSMRPSWETARMALAMSWASVSSRYWPL